MASEATNRELEKTNWQLQAKGETGPTVKDQTACPSGKESRRGNALSKARMVEFEQ